jgi:hypothetical protein
MVDSSIEKQLWTRSGMNMGAVWQRRLDGERAMPEIHGDKPAHRDFCLVTLTAQM